jgi:NADP-dependent 3-hydroxy acid dehydrogenase YdfG
LIGMSGRLSGRWVVITGASSGIGAATAVAMAREGAAVLLGARRVARLEEVARRCRQEGASFAEARRLDVADTQSVDSFHDWVQTIAPGVDVLVNNAGGAHGLDPVATARDEDWEAMVQSNLLGLARVTRALLPLLLRRSAPIVINVGSVAGHTAYEGAAMYCAVKAGVEMITRALRLELVEQGVRVGCIAPGITETEFTLVRFKGDVARARKVYEGMRPLQAEDVAEAIVWMATRPPHVCVDELIIKSTDQAEVYRVVRRGSTPTVAPSGGIAP